MRLPPSTHRFVLVLLLAPFLAAPAFAEGTMAERTLTDADKGRIAAYDATFEAAVAEARAGGSAADVAILDAVLSGNEETILGADIRGDYRCRVLKLGGSLPLTVHGWFSCRIGEDDIGYRLEKISGSQRLSGHFIDESETRLLYYGALHYGDEKPMRYGSDEERDQVGYLVKVGPDRFRLGLPEPRFESKFDILELRRK